MRWILRTCREHYGLLEFVLTAPSLWPSLRVRAPERRLFHNVILAYYRPVEICRYKEIVLLFPVQASFDGPTIQDEVRSHVCVRFVHVSGWIAAEPSPQSHATSTILSIVSVATK